jgi:hypothetical protein
LIKALSQHVDYYSTLKQGLEKENIIILNKESLQETLHDSTN